MPRFADDLLHWYSRHGRDLPWRRTQDPYRIWVSEIMLQQTRVEVVLPYYQRFLDRFPDLKTLAQARLDEVLAYWAGLGYYTRARNLHACARQLWDQYNGGFPSNYTEMVALPGIGPSTAGAILSLAFNQAHPVLDGNVKRVLARVAGISSPLDRSPGERQLWSAAHERIPLDQPRLYNQAIMDLGATLCLRKRPRCQQCPGRSHCWAFTSGTPMELPVTSPRRRLPARASWLALVVSEQGLLLQRRPPTGIWGGLWCPPMVERQSGEPPEAASTAFAAQLGGEFQLLGSLSPFQHTFSHFHLELHPLYFAWIPPLQVSEGEFQWVSAATSGEVALPSPIRRLLQTHRLDF